MKTKTANFLTCGMCTVTVGAHPPQPSLHYTLSSPRMGLQVMPQFSVFLTNANAGLKHNKSTEKSGDMNCPDN